MRLQKIQSNHAFKLLKDSGMKVYSVYDKPAKSALFKMGFVVTKIKMDKYISTPVPKEIEELFNKKAESLGLSKAALMRDMIYSLVDKKNNII